jgi:virginiamycin B lyase
VTATIRVGRGAAAVAAGPASVWVAGQGAGTIARIDPRTDQVTATIDLTGTPTSLTITGTSVWTAVRQTAVTTSGDPAVRG